MENSDIVFGGLIFLVILVIIYMVLPSDAKPATNVTQAGTVLIRNEQKAPTPVPVPSVGTGTATASTPASSTGAAPAPAPAPAPVPVPVVQAPPPNIFSEEKKLSVDIPVNTNWSPMVRQIALFKGRSLRINYTPLPGKTYPKITNADADPSNAVVNIVVKQNLLNKDGNLLTTYNSQVSANLTNTESMFVNPSQFVNPGDGSFLFTIEVMLSRNQYMYGDLTVVPNALSY